MQRDRGRGACGSAVPTLAQQMMEGSKLTIYVNVSNCLSNSSFQLSAPPPTFSQVRDSAADSGEGSDVSSGDGG